MRKFGVLGVAALVTAMAVGSGCVNAATHRAAVQDDSAERLSIAKVQREIHVGMSSSDVVSILGAPNMVTTDTDRRETWVYDKVATEQIYSNSSGGLSLVLGALGIGGSSAGLGAGGAGYSSSAGAASVNQRTITIIIKFDNNGNVRDYSYRQSSF